MSGKNNFLDVVDLKILKLLYDDARIPVSKIGSKLRVSKQVVSYRIVKLQKRGVIKQFVTGMNHAKLGMVGHVVLFQLNYVVNLKKLTEKITELESVRFISLLNGKWDLWVFFTANNLVKFENDLFNVFNILEAHLSYYEVLILVQEYRARALFGPSQARSFHNYDKKDFFRLSSEEKKVLNVIGKDSRQPVTKVAKKIGIPAKKVLKIIKNLLKNEIITEFHTLIDSSFLGLKRYYCFLNLKSPISFKSLLGSKYKITVLLRLVGRWNFVIVFLANQEVNEVVKEIKRCTQTDSVELFEVEDFWRSK